MCRFQVGNNKMFIVIKLIPSEAIEFINNTYVHNKL